MIKKVFLLLTMVLGIAGVQAQVPAEVTDYIMREVRSGARGAKVTMTITKVRVGLKDSYFKLDLSKYPNAVVIRN